MSAKSVAPGAQATDTASSRDSSLTGSESFTGMVFDSASLNTPTYDPNAVWLEGTSHTIAALVARAFRPGETFCRRLRSSSICVRPHSRNSAEDRPWQGRRFR
jgi:hypothetical protein